MDRYSNEAARASDDPDDSVPEHALARIAALEKILREVHEKVISPYTDPINYAEWVALDQCVRDLLDLDPPGFDPSTEGP